MRIVKLIPVSSLALVIALAGCASTQNSETSAELAQRAQSGDIDAEYQLGRKYASSAFPQSGKAIYWLCRAARDGHLAAQVELAELYEKRIGGSTDNPVQGQRLSPRGSAYFWYTAAASQGSDQALAKREKLADVMEADEVMEVKRRATRWRQSVCVKP